MRKRSLLSESPSYKLTELLGPALIVMQTTSRFADLIEKLPQNSVTFIIRLMQSYN